MVLASHALFIRRINHFITLLYMICYAVTSTDYKRAERTDEVNPHYRLFSFIFLKHQKHATYIYAKNIKASLLLKQQIL
jgi:hypothetical protein